MSGANALEGDGDPGPVPQAKRPDLARDFASFHNYVALPRSEAFRIEYWALEEAKLQRMPPEREFSRKIALVVGGSSGIGRETVLELAKRGAHVVVADLNLDGATEVAAEAARLSSAEAVFACGVDLGSRESVQAAIGAAVRQFGGLDVVINTAAVYPTPAPGTPVEQVWTQALALNVTSNHVLADEAARVLRAQGLPATVVLTSSANAVVPKSGSEPYDVSKTAVNHLIRELAIGLGPAHSCERDRAGHGRRRLLDVSARSRHGLAEEIQHCVRRQRNDGGASREARRLLRRRARLLVVRSRRSIAHARSAGLPATRVRERPGM